MMKYIMLSKVKSFSFEHIKHRISICRQVVIKLMSIFNTTICTGFNNVMVARLVGKARGFPLAVSLESRRICEKCNSKGVRSVRCAFALT